MSFISSLGVGTNIILILAVKEVTSISQHCSRQKQDLSRGVSTLLSVLVFTLNLQFLSHCYGLTVSNSDLLQYKFYDLPRFCCETKNLSDVMMEMKDVLGVEVGATFPSVCHCK